MPTAVTLVLAGGAAALGLFWLRRRLEDARQPPSVGRYPLVGSIFHIEEPLYLWLYEKFGNEPVVRVHHGTRCVYYFNRWSAFKEAMIDNAEVLTGRMKSILSIHLFGEYGGIVQTDGEVWRSYRRFTLKTLRDFGFGRQGAEEIIATEAEHMRSTLDAAGGRPIETMVLAATASSNVICQMVFGSRVASEDEKFAELLITLRSFTQTSGSEAARAILLSTLPVIDHFPRLIEMITRLPQSVSLIENAKTLEAFCRKHGDRHNVEIENINQARDYIEAHLQQQQLEPEMFTDMRLTLAVIDLFIAGTDTTANTLCFSILYLIDNPDVAEKMHSEIVSHIGRERLPRAQDKAHLHYSQAVIEEVHRKASILTLGVLHRLNQDITVCGNRLKANSLCGFNIYSIHHDPEVFPEPHRFLPERHLKDGQFVPSPFMATFGLGKRACLGESLARMELFIFLTALVQRYRFSLDPEDARSMWDLTEDPSFSKGAALRSPPLHRIVFCPWD